MGGGSGGMGFDVINTKTKKALEIKSCCTIQNSKCLDCNMKFNPLVNTECPYCHSKNCKTMTDSRFGIDASELLRQIESDVFDSFVMWHLSLLNADYDNHLLKLQLEQFEIDFNNDDVKEIQLDYFRNQALKGKKSHCNLLPNSFDFYKLAPKKISHNIVELNYSDLNILPNVTTIDVQPMKIHQSILRNKEKEMFTLLESYNKDDGTADIIDFTKNIPYRSKSFQKDRGDTVTNKYNILK